MDSNETVESMIREWTDQPRPRNNVVTVVGQFTSGMKLEVSTADISPHSDVPDAIAYIDTSRESLPDAPRFNVTVLGHDHFDQREAHVASVDRCSAPIQYVAHSLWPDKMEEEANTIGEAITAMYKGGNAIAGLRSIVHGLMLAGMNHQTIDDYVDRNINPVVQKIGSWPVVLGKRTTCGEAADFASTFASLLYGAAHTLRLNKHMLETNHQGVHLLLQVVSEQLHQRQLEASTHLWNPFDLIYPQRAELPVFAIDNSRTQQPAAAHRAYRPGGVFVMPPLDHQNSQLVPIAGQYDTLMLIHRMYPSAFRKPEFLSSAHREL